MKVESVVCCNFWGGGGGEGGGGEGGITDLAIGRWLEEEGGGVPIG